MEQVRCETISQGIDFIREIELPMGSRAFPSYAFFIGLDSSSPICLFDQVLSEQNERVRITWKAKI